MSESRPNVSTSNRKLKQASSNSSFNDGSIELPDGSKYHKAKKDHLNFNAYCLEHFGKSEESLLVELKADLLKKLEAAKNTLGTITSDLEFNLKMPKLLRLRLEAVEEILLEVSRQGSYEAQVQLALLYLNLGHHFNKSPADGYTWFKNAEKNSGGIYEFGKYYLDNSQPENAYRHFQNGDKQGCSNSQFMLGLMFEEGRHVKQNPSKAFNLYKAAARKKHTEATLAMVRMVVTKTVSPEKLPASVEDLLSEAIKDGSVEAKTTLATMYQHSELVERNLDKAVLLFQEAAEQGDPVAMHEYASILKEGKPKYPIDANLAEAKRWFEAAEFQTSHGLLPDRLLRGISTWLAEGERDMTNIVDEEKSRSDEQNALACLKQCESTIEKEFK
jgi:hypothetical protein